MGNCIFCIYIFFVVFFFLSSASFDRGHTALHKAVQQKHRNICYMLVAAGASLTMRDSNGLTPMMIAFQVEDNDLATYLESMFTFNKCRFSFRIFVYFSCLFTHI